MIQIRQYHSSDYDDLKSLYISANSFGGQFDPDRDSAERIVEQVTENPNSILIAEEDGKIVGTVSLLYDKRFAWLMRFALTANNEEEIADLLFRKASEILKKSGHTQVLVYAPSDDQKFKERYEELAFNIGKSYTAYWRSLD